MTWTDTIEVSNTWSDVTDVTARHTYGAKFGSSSRILYGENVSYGGGYTNPSGETTGDNWVDAT